MPLKHGTACAALAPHPLAPPHAHLPCSQLSDGKSRYISYRDSPTTELLQDALGGRGKAAWLTHLVPSRDEMDYDENRSCLRLGQCVAQIRNKPLRIRQQPHGLAPGDDEREKALTGVEAAAEERELQELQRLLTSGPSSKRPVMGPGGQASAAVSPPRAPLSREEASFSWMA